MTPAPACFICGGGEFDQRTPAYRRCRGCGHETLVAPTTQSYMLNDPLDPAEAKRGTFLERFQGKVLDRWCPAPGGRQLVDLGSGGGKFLYQHGPKFARACGVEITPAAVEFCRNDLGLTILPDVAAVTGPIDLVTAWHSLEHFSPTGLQELFATLQAKMPPGALLIISVPNGASWQYRLFGERYAFFDIPTHLQQFTPNSLRRLLASYGFAPRATALSWPYNAFGYLQGLLNCILRPHNYLYFRLKRGSLPPSLWRDFVQGILLPLATLPALGGTLLDAVFPARQGVLTCCFERRA